MTQLLGQETECAARYGITPPVLGCLEPLRVRRQELEREIERIFAPLCDPIRKAFDTYYTQQYKLWKPYSDAVRVGTDDFYFFSDPILARVYAPALNEYMAAFREVVVMGAYKQVLDMGEGLADFASGSGMKCDPPPSPEPADGSGASLPDGKKGDCPLDKPLAIDLKLVKIELDCDKFSIEGGEGLMAKVEHTFSKDETTIWVGAGVSGGGTVGTVSARDSDTGKDSNIVPTKIAPNITLEGKAGFSFTFRRQSLQDVGFSTEASGSISVAGASVSGSVSSGVSVEGGLKVGAEGGYQLPGSAPVRTGK